MHYEVEREGEEVEVPLEGVSFIYLRHNRVLLSSQGTSAVA